MSTLRLSVALGFNSSGYSILRGRERDRPKNASSASRRQCSQAQDGRVTVGPSEEARISSGFMGRTAPRTHARHPHRSHGGYWFLLDANAQNGTSVRETARHGRGPPYTIRLLEVGAISPGLKLPVHARLGRQRKELRIESRSPVST